MAVAKVTRGLNGEERELQHTEGNRYEGEAEGPFPELKTSETRSYYPLQIAAEDDSGNVTRQTKELEVKNRSVFPLKLTSATAVGEEQGYISCGLDLDIGDTNDFEIRTNLSAVDKSKMDYGYRIYVLGTEYGGLLEDMQVITKTNEVVWTGYTWRGLLMQKVVEPPKNTDHLILNGELNDVIRELVADRFGSLFVVPEINTGVTLVNWQVDRYVTLYDAIMKFLNANEYRLQLAYKKEKGPDYGYVEFQAVPIKDYSAYLRYDNDCKINFDIRDCRRGINHLICAGKGQNEERIVLHLFVQEDGSVGKSRYYTGLAEREAVYDFSSADIETLEKDGIKRLKELQNYKSVELFLDDIDIELGDIVSGREQVTGTEVKKPVVRKILKLRNGKAEIEYKIKGDD